MRPLQNGSRWDSFPHCKTAHPSFQNQPLRVETDQHPTKAGYLRADETEVNVVLSLAPRPFVTVIIATAIPAAISPYSIAVAADSSIRKVLNFPAISEK